MPVFILTLKNWLIQDLQYREILLADQFQTSCQPNEILTPKKSQLLSLELDSWVLLKNKPDVHLFTGALAAIFTRLSQSYTYLAIGLLCMVQMWENVA